MVGHLLSKIDLILYYLFTLLSFFILYAWRGGYRYVKSMFDYLLLEKDCMFE